VTPLGIEGDVHADRVHHGGPHQALMLASLEDIERLRAEGFAIVAGSLGENLTSAASISACCAPGSVSTWVVRSSN